MCCSVCCPVCWSTVGGELYLLEVLKVLEVLEVMYYVLLYMLEATGGRFFIL